MSLLPLNLLLLFSLFFPSQCHRLNTDQSFISMLITQKGLDFTKDLLVSKAISSITPLRIPQIEKVIKIPFLGSVYVALSNITIYQIDVPTSYIKPGDNGIAIVTSGSTCNLTMDWHYSYSSSWFFPVKVSDSGRAYVEVKGMEIGITLGLKNVEGFLEMSLLEGGCYVTDISIALDGGASWLYQGVVDAFDEQITSAVENAITNELKSGVSTLNSFLHELPQEIAVDETASLNVTFVNNITLTDSSVGVEISGLFSRRKIESFSNHDFSNSQSVVSCHDNSKMLGISLDEAVFTSASNLYYNTELMQWSVDNVPDQSLLNTAGWKFIVPQLYKKYPNDDMSLKITLSSPPAMRISSQNIVATVNADLTIEIIDNGEVVPVACISLVIHGSGSVKIVQNNLAGSVKLTDFTMVLKWSKIGNLRMFLIQPVVWTVIETVVLPYTNSHLEQGFPLPVIHGFTLQDAEIICSSSKITVCSNIDYTDDSPSLGFNLSSTLQKHFSSLFMKGVQNEVLFV
ncbi:putative BPI/LBP family protein At1g04970 [Impatiens glandulifera]|uniref:putative BPI/LBP family protein At1g04970 n=1 Tax=Impatiens glandulifera TaxID=253017 RepID=UPI001FB0E269|nr:putative BPI/LBP family protein At1g04970 [Impatiens glandulifera]